MAAVAVVQEHSSPGFLLMHSHGALPLSHSCRHYLPRRQLLPALHLLPAFLSALPAPPPQGDSGFIVVRNGQVVLRSSPKQHFFDCPLQFGAYPEHVDDTDTADDAELYTLPVMPGDIIIAGGGAATFVYGVVLGVCVGCVKGAVKCLLGRQGVVRGCVGIRDDVTSRYI